MWLPNPQTLGKTIPCPNCSRPFVAAEDAHARAGAPSRATVRTRRGREDDEEVDDEYGPPVVQPLGDPRTKPHRSVEAPTEPPPEESKRRKQKRKKSPDVPEPSGPKMCLFGFIGGSIGGIVWIGVAYLLHVHLGIVAILVGVLTGIGVQTGNNGQDDHGPGEIAVFTAFAVILVCKYVVACLLMDRLLFGEDALKAFTFYDMIWCTIAGRWAYRTASGALF
jgi:hypothetical protein